MSRKIKKLKKPLWLDWNGAGYLEIPAEPLIPFPASPHVDTTLAWVSAFQHARRGDFRYVEKIPQARAEDEKDELFYNTAAYLIGDAGPGRMFAELVSFVSQDHWNFELAYAWCRAIAARGRLRDVPALIHAYEANINDINDDNDIILMHVAQVIDDGEIPKFSGVEGFRDLDDYRTQVQQRCAELASRFGGEDVLLWRGEPTSVRRMARHLIELAHAEYAYLPSWTRHRFEASTGIDCSAMFDRHRRFQPLQAAAIAETFLDSPAAHNYLEGVRYFFGHQVPDSV